jgi:hypothetical protein
VLTRAINIVAQKKDATLKFYEDVLVLGVRNPRLIACDVWSLRFQDKA